ncbi:DNA-directed DNA polymerase epsilon, subunit B, partial [Cryomyces antarcticus]
STTKPTLFPPPSHKTLLFRDRYNLIHQRLLRNEAFQTPSFDQQSSNTLTRSDSMTVQQSYKITPIANLLGRSGSSHLLLGLLTVAPTGTLAISDLTGSIALDLQHAKPHVGEDAAWFCPGMIVLIDGVYEEDYNSTTSGLGQTGGIGGTIGGKFIGFSIGGPPCERRNVTVGVSDGVKSENGDVTAGAGFGWVDFLGVGSERATGSKLRRTEQRLLGPGGAHTGNARMIVCGEVNLDSPGTLEALHKMLRSYATDDADRMPMTVVLMGNFVTHAVMAGGNSGSGGSIEYKEYFNALASVLTEYPALLRRTTFVLVPGDKDPWASAFSAGASTVIPKKGVPDIFTSRVKRAFAEANREAGVKKGGVEGEAVFATNPARMSLFGPAHEIVLFRDDITSRLRRTAIRFATPSHDPEQGEPVDADATMMSGGLGTDSSTREDTMDVDTPAPAPAASPSADFETLMARKLVRTVLDQSHLSPFPLSTRPVHWDYASALQLYPLPTTLVLADAEAPAFAVTYEGCHVMNPGRLVRDGRGNQIGWLEYDVVSKRGVIKEDML